MKSELISLLDSPEGFVNTVVAHGPGLGINRMRVVVRDAVSIAEYGERQEVVDFPTAVDAADLERMAREHLARVSDPAQHQTFSVRVTGQNLPKFRLGQRVRVSDARLGLSTTAKIVEWEGTPHEMTLHLGEAPVNLLDVLNAERDADREALSLGLPAPVGLRVKGIINGLEVLVNPFLNSRAVGVEIHASRNQLFTPDASTKAAEGAGTRFTISGLGAGRRYYVKARSFDDRGNYSPWSDEVSAVTKAVSSDELDRDTRERIRFADEQARVLEQRRHVYERAEAITEDLKITRDTLEQAVQDELDGLDVSVTENALAISAVETTVTDQGEQINSVALDLDAFGANLSAVEGQVLELEDDLGTTIGRVNEAELDISAFGVRLTAAEEDVDEFGNQIDLMWSEIDVAADGVRIISARFERTPLVLGDDTEIVYGDNVGAGDAVEVIGQVPAADELGVTAGFSSLAVTQQGIEAIVMGQEQTWSRFAVLEDEISGRVTTNEMTAALLLHEEGILLTVSDNLNDLDGQLRSYIDVGLDNVTVAGDQITLDGNTNVLGSFTVTGENMVIDANATFTGDINMVSGSLHFFHGAATNANRRLVIGPSAANYFGAPPGTVLSAELGHGIHLKGTPKIVDMITFGVQAVTTSGAWVNGEVYSHSGESTEYAPSGGFQVPAGKRWIILPAVRSNAHYRGTLVSDALKVSQLSYTFEFRGIIAGGGQVGPVIPAGSYTQLRAVATFRVLALEAIATGTSRVSSLGGEAIILEIDA